MRRPEIDLGFERHEESSTSLKHKGSRDRGRAHALEMVGPPSRQGGRLKGFGEGQAVFGEVSSEQSDARERRAFGLGTRGLPGPRKDFGAMSEEEQVASRTRLHYIIVY